MGLKLYALEFFLNLMFDLSQVTAFPTTHKKDTQEQEQHNK